jgi:hypothetical protein
MFLHGQDPVSIHCLALGGGEIAEWLAEKAGAQPFKNHIFETFPALKMRDIRAVQRKNWNAFKHATTMTAPTATMTRYLLPSTLAIMFI